MHYVVLLSGLTAMFTAKFVIGFFPNSSITFSVAAFCGSSFLLCLDFYTKFSTSRQKWFRRGKGMKVLNFKI